MNGVSRASLAMNSMWSMQLLVFFELVIGVRALDLLGLAGASALPATSTTSSRSGVWPLLSFPRSSGLATHFFTFLYCYMYFFKLDSFLPPSRRRELCLHLLSLSHPRSCISLSPSAWLRVHAPPPPAPSTSTEASWAIFCNMTRVDTKGMVPSSSLVVKKINKKIP